MRNSILVSGVILGVSLVACSKPAPETDATTQQQADPVTAVPAPVEPQVVSKLEAGQAGLDLVGNAPQKTREPASKPRVVSQVRQPAAVMAEVTPALSSTARTTELTAPASMPMAALPAVAPAGQSPSPAMGIGGSMPDVPIRPAIIIRGGPGGIHDTCRNHGPGTFGPGGIAINNRSPVLVGGGGGGVMVNQRAPRLGGYGRMPRGGIR